MPSRPSVQDWIGILLIIDDDVDGNGREKPQHPSIGLEYSIPTTPSLVCLSGFYYCNTQSNVGGC